eukprot:TRINITY_DN14875_c0_g1_i1.p1 TRINITY_DN14875_c0_g1~~TRINITY_DN14875_c0_g1_i1.p1  ORF type:complete len:591 (+),score=232.09 TRINITY_DN14875_c0_g1_i1:72-1844(+)
MPGDDGEALRRLQAKQALKAAETPEEKRARRLAKKQRKDELRSQGAAGATPGYSNDANPFGDSTLTESFTWKKKIDRERQDGTFDPRRYTREAEMRKRQELAEEIEKVKKRRAERDEELAQWEEERTRMQADQDGLTLEEWEERGNQFELDQLALRAANRFREHRAKPIDVLFRTLRVLASGHVDAQDLRDLGGDVRDPGRLVSALSVADLRELAPELAQFEGFDARFREHWKALRLICQDELATQLRGGEQAGVHQNVRNEVHSMFAGKSLKELTEAEGQMELMAQGAVAGADVEYWAALLKGLGVWKAKAFLRDDYEARLDAMEQDDAGDDEGAADNDPAAAQGAAAAAPAADRPPAAAAAAAGAWRPTVDSDSDLEDDLGELQLSPRLRPLSQLKEGEVSSLIDARDNMRDILARRFAGVGSSRGSSHQEQERLMHSRGEKLGTGEDLFDDQVALKASYSWHDKYRPRKPKYFNRVHTGFDWHKYNSTHYDVDNPPPKVVQGYKFNIFYPDLVDPTQEPRFHVEPTERGWRDDVCIIRFSAGPPYEDIAFKIVNREWDYNSRRGYKCTFDRGVFHLYFSFVRYRYRR